MPATPSARDATAAELLVGIVTDTGELLGAHVDAIRHELAEGLADLRQRTQAIASAAAVLIATTVTLAIAIALTLVRQGLPAWIAFWLVGGALLAASVVLMIRAGRSAGPAHPTSALSRAGADASWLAERAVEAVT